MGTEIRVWRTPAMQCSPTEVHPHHFFLRRQGLTYFRLRVNCAPTDDLDPNLSVHTYQMLRS